MLYQAYRERVRVGARAAAIRSSGVRGYNRSQPRRPGEPSAGTGAGLSELHRIAARKLGRRLRTRKATEATARSGRRARFREDGSLARGARRISARDRRARAVGSRGRPGAVAGEGGRLFMGDRTGTARIARRGAAVECRGSAALPSSTRSSNARPPPTFCAFASSVSAPSGFRSGRGLCLPRAPSRPPKPSAWSPATPPLCLNACAALLRAPRLPATYTRFLSKPALRGAPHGAAAQTTTWENT